MPWYPIIVFAIVIVTMLVFRFGPLAQLLGL